MPHSSGSTPNEACSPANVGDHLVPNRKSADRHLAEELDRLEQQRADDRTVVTTDSSAAPISATLITPSARERAEGSG